MKYSLRLTGYFKFKPIAERVVRVRSDCLSDLLVVHAVSSGRTPVPARNDAVNALLGRCAVEGWYKNRGWRPNSSRKCLRKDEGDILGVCATIEDMPGTRLWMYSDPMFDTHVTKDFSLPGEPLALHLSQGCLVDMERIPDQDWLDSFCRKTHDPVAFSCWRFGYKLTKDEIELMIEKFPKNADYFKRMFMK